MVMNDLLIIYFRDFPGGPVTKTLRSQCRGPRFDPWLGNQIPHAATKDSRAATNIKTPHAVSKTQCSKTNENKYKPLKNNFINHP